MQKSSAFFKKKFPFKCFQWHESVFFTYAIWVHLESVAYQSFFKYKLNVYGINSNAESSSLLSKSYGKALNKICCSTIASNRKFEQIIYIIFFMLFYHKGKTLRILMSKILLLSKILVLTSLLFFMFRVVFPLLIGICHCDPLSSYI